MRRDPHRIAYPVTAAELETLAWLADRYESARALLDSYDPDTRTIGASAARRSYAAIPDDGGSHEPYRLPPCMGDELARKTADAYARAGAYRGPHPVPGCLCLWCSDHTPTEHQETTTRTDDSEGA